MMPYFPYENERTLIHKSLVDSQPHPRYPLLKIMAAFARAQALETRNLVLDEIWEMLKRRWTIARHDFTDVALNGENIPIDNITIPSQGICRVIPRISTDRYYDDEVLRSSLIHYYTRGESEGEFIGTQGERYAFRRRNGIWSLWDIGRPQTPGYFKITDFRLKTFKEELIGQYKTFEVVLDAPPWIDEFGRNFFQMAFLKGRTTLVWELRCRFDDHATGTVRQWMDICTPIETPRNDMGKKEGSTNESQACRENRDGSIGGERIRNQSLERRKDENGRLGGNKNFP